MLQQNAQFLLFVKGALLQSRFGLTKFALLVLLVKLADDAPQASRPIENRLGRFLVGLIVELRPARA